VAERNDVHSNKSRARPVDEPEPTTPTAGLVLEGTSADVPLNTLFDVFGGQPPQGATWASSPGWSATTQCCSDFDPEVVGFFLAALPSLVVGRAAPLSRP
jgi:hypothetical protein